ncbi:MULTISPECIES: TorF family putative porin [Cupriavidus]|uniref:Uncharacterized protein n=1 Tax=Cupriavidus oxalaticus TaxID=96344 RepID=A0A4P7LJ32_9BURK|nr:MULTISPECIES: TorF family putative porin [Cupriavidus]MBF6989176.1 hypothetical protein [Cupriavidus sp. IK-TO18]QBY55598.1 hypothetical protein E0W60_31860 [Cupriavidus oxalaticus]
MKLSSQSWSRAFASGCLLACGAGAAPGVFAQEEPKPPASPHTFSANVALMSNYVFRGITYTQDRPALQGGFDYAHDSGLYAGVWATNVSSKAINGASLEMDLYGGFTKSFGDWRFDVGLLQFYYPENPKLPGSDEKYNTLELYGAVGWKFVTLKYSSTLTDFFGFNSASMGTNQGSSHGSGYLELNADVPLPEDFVLGLHVGRQWVRNYGAFNYTDWRAVVSKSFGTGWTVSLAYTGTNADRSLWVADGKRLGTAHWILGLKRVF